QPRPPGPRASQTPHKLLPVWLPWIGVTSAAHTACPHHGHPADLPHLQRSTPQPGNRLRPQGPSSNGASSPPGRQRKDASDIEAAVSPDNLSPAWMINDGFPIVVPAEMLHSLRHPSTPYIP
ncbi:mCG140052, partial [Mus musculus]